MPRTRAPYPPEFRREAIHLVRASDEDKPVPKVVRELSVSPETSRYRIKQGDTTPGSARA